MGRDLACGPRSAGTWLVYACVHCGGIFFTFFLHQGRFFFCNDVDLIKNFIEFHKIISYTAVTGDLLEEELAEDSRK